MMYIGTAPPTDDIKLVFVVVVSFNFYFLFLPLLISPDSIEILRVLSDDLVPGSATDRPHQTSHLPLLISPVSDT